MTDEVKTEMPIDVKIDIPQKVLVDANAARGTKLDVNGIPKYLSKSSGTVKTIDSKSKNTFFREYSNGTETEMGLYNSVNAIRDLLAKPGELFIMSEKNNGGTILNGFNNGIVFVAAIGSLLAVTAVVLGVPDAHLQFRPSLIFGFA